MTQERNFYKGVNMKITQISTFLENKKGRLYEVTELLGKNKINIRALTIAESEDFGVLRMVVDNPKKALEVLKKNGFVSSFTDIIAVEVDDQPGGLSKILKTFNDNNVNVEYMYGFVEKASDKALLVFRFDDTDKAITVLNKNKIKIVGTEGIENL
ncbi:amino acid-binding ACT domain protein [sediment metagenome]|uniref:Amino acid-binding ACT domain protein n=1 Tax=sediment metagenome TaxID=749907 RepID=D9PF01_9ZZZZ